MKKLTISDLQPGFSFTLGEHYPLYYVVVCVHYAPIRATFGNCKVLKHPCVVCSAILKNSDHLSQSQVDIPLNLLKKVPFYEY